MLNVGPDLSPRHMGGESSLLRKSENQCVEEGLPRSCEPREVLTEGESKWSLPNGRQKTERKKRSFNSDLESGEVCFLGRSYRGSGVQTLMSAQPHHF